MSKIQLNIETETDLLDRYNDYVRACETNRSDAIADDMEQALTGHEDIRSSCRTYIVDNPIKVKNKVQFKIEVEADLLDRFSSFARSCNADLNDAFSGIMMRTAEGHEFICDLIKGFQAEDDPEYAAQLAINQKQRAERIAQYS